MELAVRVMKCLLLAIAISLNICEAGIAGASGEKPPQHIHKYNKFSLVKVAINTRR